MGNPAPVKSWVKGQSGNPAGKQMAPTRADAIAIFRSHSPAMMRKACELALAGDTVLLRAAMSKILPDKLEVDLSGQVEICDLARMMAIKYGDNPQLVEHEDASGSLVGEGGL